jgi:hypothetical protein
MHRHGHRTQHKFWSAYKLIDLEVDSENDSTV